MTNERRKTGNNKTIREEKQEIIKQIINQVKQYCIPKTDRDNSDKN